MFFNSAQFLAFFAIVLTLYYALRERRRQNVLLLIASYVFYSAWDVRFLSLIVASTAVDFVAACRIQNSSDPRRRKLWLAVSLGFNLGMLAIFKYLNFGLESFAELLGWIGLSASVPTLQIILPVGISFYTFQTISYTVDVYRRQRAAVDDLLDFALYVAYFPQLVAGPIEKSTTLLPQLQQARRIERGDVQVGVMWISLGYFKKVVIADTLAPMVDHAFAEPARVSGMVSLVAVLAFAIQIYGDFAGYSLIARGLSRLMGIRLMQNFNAPYLSRSPREFWHRWHISLSSWLREYLYFGLGGSRSGRVRTHVNLMATMLLGGLWHGASWNFVLWGAYHGFLLMVCHAFGSSRRFVSTSPVVVCGQIAVTFAFTLFGWLLFRVTSVAHLGLILNNIVTNFHYTPDLSLYLRPTLAAFGILMAYHVWQEYSGDALVLLRAHPRFRLGLYAFVVSTIIVVGFRPTPFVYFQF